MIEKLDNPVFSNYYIVFGNLNSAFVTFCRSDICLNSITLDNINLKDNNCDYCDSKNILAWHNKLSNQRI